jgi:ABC-type transport system involved in multi-copper enzyme maturation permease subunit
MDPKLFFRYCLYATGVVTAAIWSLIAWDYYHGGIPAHHFLNDPELPSVSNAWGGLLLPILTAYLLYRIQKRNQPTGEGRIIDVQNLRKVFFAFAVSVIYAIIIALSFSLGYNAVSEFIFPALLILSLIFPFYRAEYYLGFVLGLTYFFGAVLPSGVGAVVVIISAAANFGVHPLLLKLKNRVFRL